MALDGTSVETELKLRLSPKVAARLLDNAVVRAYAASAAPLTERIKTIYFDSPERTLWRNGTALRLRRSQRRWRQSVKDAGREIAGLHSHREIEHDVPAGAPAPELLPAEVRRLLEGVGGSLSPVFATDIRRTTLGLRLGEGREIELVLDRGSIRSADRREPICEAELELKAGPPGAVYALALALHKALPFALEHRTKAERGYALVDGTPPAVRGAQPIALAADMPAHRALGAAAAEGLHQLGANEMVARRGADIEGVHQMRVGLRRLKVVLALADKVRPVAERATLKKELDWIGDVLGRARDLDVFIDETLTPLAARAPGGADLERLRRRADKARREAYAALCEALDSPRYVDALLRLGAWIAGLESPEPDDLGYPSLGEIATALLDKRYKRLRKFARQHGWQNKPELHALRLHAKKLRYTAAFFAPLYPRKHTRTFLAAVSELQDVLGLAHDSEVARQVLAQLGTRPAPESAPGGAWRRADALVEGWHLARGAEVARRIEPALRALEEAKRFW